MRIMRLLQWITNAGVTRGEDPVTLPLHRWGIEADVHELVHVLECQHVAVQLDYPFVPGQREWDKFAPAVIESRIIGKILIN